jgi:hypothetical protein
MWRIYWRGLGPYDHMFFACSALSGFLDATLADSWVSSFRSIIWFSLWVACF